MRTLPERLQERGYRTAAFLANPFLGRYTGYAQGFDVFENLAHTLVPQGFVANVLVPGPGRSRGRAVTRRAIRWMAEEPDRPFFAFLNLMEAHAPYGWFPGWPEGIPGEDPRTRSIRALQVRFQKELPYLRCGARTLEPGEVETLVRLYDAGIRYLDELVGRLIDSLEAGGRLTTPSSSSPPTTESPSASTESGTTSSRCGRSCSGYR